MKTENEINERLQELDDLKALARKMNINGVVRLLDAWIIALEWVIEEE